MTTYIVLRDLYDPDQDDYRINNDNGKVEHQVDGEWLVSAYNGADVSTVLLSLAAGGFEVVDSHFDYDKPYGDSILGRDYFYKSFLINHDKDPDYAEGAKAFLHGKPFVSPYQENMEMWGQSHHSWCAGYTNAQVVVDQLGEKE